MRSRISEPAALARHRSERRRARDSGSEPAQAKATKRFFKRLLKGLQFVPRVIVTDKLKSSGAAKREVLPGRRAPLKPVPQ
jgi:hypothetical protein